jgi:hypothetical protein
MSLGFGTGVIGAFYALINFAYQKVMERWMCSIELTDRDPILKWVSDYMKDHNMITDHTRLKVEVKPPA